MTTASAPATLETVAIAVDRAQLATDVLRPQRAGAYPTLLVRTPYDRRALHDVLAVVDPLEAPRRGWALVLQDVRGSGGSSGRFSFLADDAADGAATIAWITAQPWSDGRVAMAGRSYPGRVQELAASARPPGLVAIAPEACGSSRDTWHPGGVLALGPAAGWIARLARAADVAVDASDALALVRRVADPADPLALACVTLRPGLLDRDASMWEHVEPSGEALAELPCFRCTGWYDGTLAPTLERHRVGQALGAGSAHKLVVGPWGHDALDGRYAGVDLGPAASAAALGLGGLRERFYAAALAGRPADEVPNAHVFVTGRNAWQTFDAWPPPTRERTWFLARGGGDDGNDGPRTLRDAPAAEGTVARFLGDPRDPVPDLGVENDVGPVDRRALCERRDVLVYRGAPLEHELELAGCARAELLVSSDARDFDLMVRLWDAHPDGRQLGVADGVVNRTAYGALDRASGLVALPVPLSPCHHVLRPGHALVVTIQSSEYPRYVPNPQTGRRLADGPPYDVHVAAHAIHEGQATPSRLLLPCVA